VKKTVLPQKLTNIYETLFLNESPMILEYMENQFFNFT